MKKVFSLLISLFLTLTGFSQSCLPEGIEFYSQSEIDNFQTNFPDCTEIEGDVIITGLDIQNLNGLIALTHVGGSLVIGDYFTGSPKIKNLTGLDNVTAIGGSLLITENDSLISLTGLENVVTIGGTLSIDYTHRLKNLSGLENLTFIDGSLGFDSNDSLISLTGLDNVISIGYNISIFYNPLLNNIDALHNLTSLNNDVIISGNDALASLIGFSNLTSILGDFEFSSSTLNTLEGLENLVSVGGELAIRYHPALVSLSALSGLTSINGRLEIRSNSSLIDLDGLDNINAESIAQLHIFYNSSLSTCDAQSICDYLAIPNGEIYIHDNAAGCNSQEEVESACLIGIDESATPEPQIAINPNPSSTTITITLPSTTPIDNTTLSIYNVNAQQVISHRITEPITVLDIGTLPSGVYFVSVTNDRTVMVGKFVKQ